MSWLSAVLRIAFLLGASFPAAPAPAAVPIEQLEDLTGGAIPIATLRERDNFANEFRYNVTVRNRTSHPIRMDSLIVVLDEITDLAGKDAKDRIEVIGNDGVTPDGKPYYKVPVGGDPQLAPYGESEPANIRLRNPYYTILFTPFFRVLGQQLREEPPRGKPPLPPIREREASAVCAKEGKDDAINRLVEILIRKGVLTQDEWTGEKPKE
jgi:hypothetical protein